MRAKFDYDEIDKVLRELLETSGFSVTSVLGSSARKRFTYQCEEDDMVYVAKFGVVVGDDDKRVRAIKNEVAAVKILWDKYPKGETNSFVLPPGSEKTFDKVYKGWRVYGYTRFYVDGRVLGVELRKGRADFKQWQKRFVDIVKEIDSLPDLDLPRTEEKKDADFSKVIVEHTADWARRLTGKGFLPGCVEDVSSRVTNHFSQNNIVVGTVHGELNPDHIIYDDVNPKPYLVNFTKLCQSYPRFVDIAMMYAWVAVVLGDIEQGMSFWKEASSRLNKGQLEYLRNLTNEMILGTLCNYLDPLLGNGELKVGCDVFMR